MKPADLAGRIPDWLDASGPSSDVVLSSRVRLARNVADAAFPHRADEAGRSRSFEKIARALRESTVIASTEVWELEDLGAWERALLLERHLVTSRLVDGPPPRGVCVGPGERLDVMIHEEDHVRIQSVVSGFDLPGALAGAVDVDRDLEGRLEWAVSAERGYLTACPTNVGTGMRASVLVHLPGLVLAGEIRKVHRAVGEMGMAVRGWFGEGSRAMGDFYQISNQRKLGLTEEETIEGLEKVCRRILELEAEAREGLVAARDRRRRLEDRVYRSWGTLRNARLLGVEAVMGLVSDVRLGKWMNRFEHVPNERLNRLALRCQPAHLGSREARVLEGDEGDWARATWIRAEFAEFPADG